MLPNALLFNVSALFPFPIRVKHKNGHTHSAGQHKRLLSCKLSIKMSATWDFLRFWRSSSLLIGGIFHFLVGDFFVFHPRTLEPFDVLSRMNLLVQ